MRREIENIILIEVDSDEQRAAVLRGKYVQELLIERTDAPSKVGNIYYGRVAVVNNAIKAAFVNIGLGRNCFLPLSEYPGEIKAGNTVFVQISKDEIGSKPYRLTGFISVVGRFLIFIPNSPRGGISKHISEKEERARLRKFIDDLKSKYGGAWILRTCAYGRSGKEIFSDASHLNAIWKTIKKVSSKNQKIGLVFRPDVFTTKALRELLNAKTTKILVEPQEEFDRAKKYIKNVAPEKKGCLKFNKSRQSLFQIYGVENLIRNLTKPKISLHSGGEIVIQSTEALTAIDVNSKGFKKKVPGEQAAFITNKEASVEIMRQLRLRNIGGIIVCDLIDMRNPLHKKEIYDTMFKGASFDRAKIDILALNRLGLIEITRQRIEDNILEKITAKCRHCEGSGRQLSPRTMFIRIKRHILRSRESFKGSTLNIFVHPSVAEMFDESAEEKLSKAIGCRLRIRADYKVSEQEYEIE